MAGTRQPAPSALRASLTIACGEQGALREDGRSQIGRRTIGTQPPATRAAMAYRASNGEST